jgi:3'-5' exoribonuclease
MTRADIRNLNDGDAVEEVYLVADKQLRSNRQGNPYLQLELRDRTGSITARLWNATEGLQRLFEPGDFLQVKGKVQLFQGALQMILSHISAVETDKLQLGDFLPHTEQDIARMLERLRQLLKLGNPHLRSLMECFLIDEALVRGLSRAPAGVRNHHAYIGGLLEHVVNLLELADRAFGGNPRLFPDVDRDLVLAGLFLHDIGKVRELTYDQGFGYSEEGQLVGHLVIGVTMLDEKVKELEKLLGEPFPAELHLRLKHIIVSHHGTYEFGSPKLPMTPEALAVHYLDNLDAKLHSFTRDIREDRNAAASFTPFSQALQRKLFKGLANGKGTSGDEEPL